MYNYLMVTDDLYWVGSDEHRLALFENIHPLYHGVSYNAYVLLDEKTVLFDTADWAVSRQFLTNVKAVLNGRPLDYLVINHVEPDHAASIEEILLRWPDVKIITTPKAVTLLNQFGFGLDPSAIEEVAQVMGQLIREGKILHWGLSTVTEDIIRRAHAVCPVTAVQNIFSMLDRDTEKLLPALEELHIGLVTHCPLAKGFLTAAYDKNSVFPEGDWRGRMELFTEEGIQKRQAVLDLIGAKAQEKNATPAQISLAWLMGKRPWIVPIPGTRKMERMIENGGAANIHLTEAEIVEIDRKLDDFIGPVQ